LTFSESESLDPKAALAAYGKSFNWARRFLGHKMGSDAAVLYRFCRVLDDMADGDIIDGPKRLEYIREDLLAKRPANDPLLAGFQYFIEARQLPITVIIALIDGLLGDQKVVQIKDETELLRYCYRVAGTVGVLMCSILNCDDGKAKDYAIDLGIAMQLTNIARDVLEDAQMGRRYLPESWVGDITPKRIVEISKSPELESSKLICSGMQKLLELADKYYESGLVGCSYLPIRAHISISTAAVVYKKIGIKIVDKKFAWYEGRTFTKKSEKIKCSIQAFIFVHRRLLQVKPHNQKLHDTLRGFPYVR
jgi:phytoene synthase